MQNLNDEIQYSASNGGKVLVAFLAGAAAGALTALLTAPRSGRETRMRIRDIAAQQTNKLGRAREAIMGAKDAAKNAFSESMNVDREPGASV